MKNCTNKIINFIIQNVIGVNAFYHLLIILIMIMFNA